MNILIPCAHCDRYVRSQEASCPFCHGALATPELAAGARPMARALVRDQPRALGRSQSRAAAFALRAALVAPAALGCGGEEGAIERDGSQEVAAAGSGGSSAGVGGSTAAGVGGSADAPAIDLAAAAGAGGALGGGALAGGNDDVDAGGNDGNGADAGFVPVPIYGGVFPDPVTRARV